jgi:hypothetical protein
MLQPYLNIWDWNLIFDHAVKEISSPGIHSTCIRAKGGVGGPENGNLLLLYVMKMSLPT